MVGGWFVGLWSATKRDDGYLGGEGGLHITGHAVREGLQFFVGSSAGRWTHRGDSCHDWFCR
jgi:hypothetical protein